MKRIINSTIFFAAVAIVAFSCRPSVKQPDITKGNLNLTKYVAIGNSITSGYADGALYNSGQQVSYANLIAQQFKLAGGGDFKQPLVDASSIGVGVTGNAPYVLSPSTDCQGVTSLAPVPKAQFGDVTIFTNSVAAQGPFNNMGVPGAKAITTVYPGYGNPANGAGNYNPFFTRMTTSPATASILGDAAAQKPTFFSMFIGNNDVLAYALTGGTADAITPSDGAPGFGFDASIDAIVSTMMASGAQQGVVANIPDITSLPYFTTIPYNALVLDAAKAQALTAAYAALGITFQAGANGFIIQDNAAPAGIRQIQQGELVLLSVPQDSIKCAGWGSLKPIPAKYVLTAQKITAIQNATAAYNTKLKATATANGLAFADVNAFLQSAKSGISFNGITVSAQFVTGGAFSLDGVHLTPLGNALLANVFIKAINSTYHSTIPLVEVTNYHGVQFP